jgi:hypothetical protein
MRRLVGSGIIGPAISDTPAGRLWDKCVHRPLPVTFSGAFRRAAERACVIMRKTLFVHQFSHAWFDFRAQQDDFANYFENSVVLRFRTNR